MNVQYPHTDAEVAATTWEEITKDRYHGLLGCLPPARWSGKAFAVGEPLCHMNDGRVVHEVCVGPVDGKFYSKPFPLVVFDPKAFIEEIKAQAVALVS